MTKTLNKTINKQGIATIALNRPQVHNAFNEILIDELTTAIIELESNNKVRIIVLTGNGKSFSAGADLNWMKSMAGADENTNKSDAKKLATLMRTLDYCSKPTIAKINGSAFGGGIGLIACCDIAIASVDAKFAFSETKLGLIPAVISPYVMRLIGRRHARRFFINAEIFTATKAKEINLINEVVEASFLDNAIQMQIDYLLKAAPRAITHCKNLISLIGSNPKAKQTEIDAATAELIAKIRITKEAQEGMNAFLNKEFPNWIEK